MRKLLILAVMAAAVAVIVSSGSALAGPSITVGSEQKISDTAGGFGGALDSVDTFGSSVASIGDLDGDGVTDLAVGARFDDDGGTDRGAVWILFMNTNGTVKSEQKISDTQGNFNGILDNDDRFGISAAGIGDLDGDGVRDLAVGAFLDDDGGFRRGAVWILFLNTDGTVKSEQKISDTQGNFNGDLDNSDLFGTGVASIGDLDGDGVLDLAVGVQQDDDGGVNRGALWVLFMNTNGTVKSEQKISDTQGNFNGILDDRDIFGDQVEGIGDLDGDGVPDLAAGARQDDDGGVNRGALWILFLNTDGTVKSEQKISDTQGNFNGVLDNNDLFGHSPAAIGDLDGDGVLDLAVGAPTDDDGGLNRGAVWVLFMNTDGTVKSEQKISDTQGNFGGILDDGDAFGAAAAIGDLDGDGVLDLAVGANRDDDGGTDRGAVWILFLKLDSDGDGVSDASDLCPGTAGGATADANGCSDAQVDGDSDGVCDPGAPSAGPSGCTGSDACPGTPAGETVGADGCTPTQGIENLLADVDGFGLPNGVANSLTASLNQATAILSDGNPNNDAAVCGKLTAFINKVDAKEQNGQLTAGQASQLRQSAEVIKATLGCP